MKKQWQKIADWMGGASADEPSHQVDLTVATTVLFLEMAYADETVSEEEEQHMRDTLSAFFKISVERVEELIEVAAEKRQSHTDIWFFTSQIKERFDRDTRKVIVEKLWGLVLSDGKVDKYEEALVKKISRLLGLSHGEMIEGKLKAKEETS